MHRLNYLTARVQLPLMFQTAIGTAACFDNTKTAPRPSRMYSIEQEGMVALGQANVFRYANSDTGRSTFAPHLCRSRRSWTALNIARPMIGGCGPRSTSPLNTTSPT
jgi:hypothetical protein